MNDLEWKLVHDQRVALVPSEPGRCKLGEIYCPFARIGCRSEDNVVPCRTFPGAHSMLITEEQLPDYLAERLMEGT